MRRGFGFHDRHSPFRFDPATLFIGGAIEGAFYNPSNITTLFQDDAGTTPVTAVEQTVGRMLDLSGNANHATQSVLASRPTLSARVNQLLRSEQFDAGSWDKIFCSVTSNTTIAPDGTTTADTLTQDTPVANSRLFQSVTIVSGATYTHSLYVKKSVGQWVSLTALDTATQSNGFQAWFDLDNGVVGNSITAGSGATFVSASITPARNGFWRIAITGSVPASGVQACWFVINTANNTSNRVAGGTAFIWGADVRSVNESSNIPAYQRVNTATDYDTVGFPLYLRFDGSNDSMLTSAIDFTGTNKMTVCAGVTKSSDAAAGVLVELTSSISTNNGAFAFFAPDGAAPRYLFSSKGTGQASAQATGYTAPITNALTGIGDISGDISTLRVNGAQAATSSTDQGAGNYSNSPLYIGRRNNATLPFNGRLYGLIVLGAAASDWQVYVTEQWMAGKTGLQF